LKEEITLAYRKGKDGCFAKQDTLASQRSPVQEKGRKGNGPEKFGGKALSIQKGVSRSQRGGGHHRGQVGKRVCNGPATGQGDRSVSRESPLPAGEGQGVQEGPQ